FLAVIVGKPLAASSFGVWFHLSREQLILAMAAYGFVASVLPVWMLLCPRDYLSSFMKIGTIAVLVVAVVIVNPELKMPGIAQILSRLPGLRGLMDCGYHFAIMFEALFILTTSDTGTRVARFLVQEFLGRFYAPMSRHEWVPGSVISTLMVVSSWGYFIW